MITDTYSNSITLDTATALAAQVAADDAARNAGAALAAATHVDLSDKSPAYRIGYEDAVAHEAFCPEAYFASPQRISSYTLGFLTAAPHNTVAQAYWREFLDADAADRKADADHYAFVTGLGR